MEKIDVAKLLKECPSGMKLDSTMYENIVFDKIIEDDKNFPIRVIRSDGLRMSLTKYGQYSDIGSAKCIIFPEGKTTWEGFNRPFKDGDIVTCKDGGSLIAFIYKERKNVAVVKYHFALYIGGVGTFTDGEICLTESELVFATEEEKAELFNAIKANGYKWSDENKTLEKLIEPKFNVGDKIKHKDTVLTIINIQTNSYIVENEPDNFGILMFSQQDKWELINEPKFKAGDEIVNIYRKHLNGDSRSWKIYQITNDKYIFTDGSFIYIKDQNNWVLSTAKFDVTTLKPFDKVLARCSTLEKWRIQLFEKYDKTYQHPFICIGCNKYKQCIPYEGNEHLLDTADDCEEYFNLIS